MNRFSKIATLILAGTTSAMLMSSVSFASVADYTQLEQSVKNGLIALQVSTDNIGKLSMTQVSQLSSILDSSQSTPDKQAAATFLIDEAVHPTAIVKGNPGAMQMAAELQNELDTAGLKHPPLETLTFVQVQELLAAFNGSDGTKLKATKAAAILDAIAHPVMVSMGNAGAMQLQAELKTKLERVGLKIPAPEKLTFAQVSSLTLIFDQKGTDADMKAAAMKVLGIS